MVSGTNMTTPSKITVLSLATLLLWANGAHASGGAHAECAMTHMEDGTGPDVMEIPDPPAPRQDHGRTPPAPAMRNHDGHTHAPAKKAGSLDAALKAAVHGGGSCLLRSGGNICPLMGSKSLFRHGPCCAAQCGPPHPESGDTASAGFTASPALENGANEVYPSGLALARAPGNRVIISRPQDGPEPRPPAC